MTQARSHYLLIAHGSRRQAANQGLFDLVERFRKAYPNRSVMGCFLDVALPRIPEGIERCIQEGAREIFLIPLMVFEGKHVREDIPTMIQDARAKHPHVDFHYAAPLSEDPRLIPLLERMAKGAVSKR